MMMIPTMLPSGSKILTIITMKLSLVVSMLPSKDYLLFLQTFILQDYYL